MISITITGDTPAELKLQFSQLFSEGAKTYEAVPKAEKSAKPAKPAKEEPEDDSLGGDEEESTGPSADDVRKAVQKAVKASPTNRDTVKDLLKKFKAKNVTDLKEEHYQDMLDELEML